MFYNTPSSVNTPPCNDDVERRLNKPVPPRRSVPLSMDLCRKLEDQLCHMRDLFSFQGWLIQTLLKMASDMQTSPLFRQAITSLHLVTETLVRTASTMSVAL